MDRCVHPVRIRRDTTDACSSLQAFNISTLDGPPGATPIAGEAAIPHAHLSLPEGGALTTASGTDLWLVCDPRNRAAECWNNYAEVLLKHDPKSRSRIPYVVGMLGALRFWQGDLSMINREPPNNAEDVISSEEMKDIFKNLQATNNCFGIK
jgi:hypothetical protein